MIIIILVGDSLLTFIIHWFLPVFWQGPMYIVYILPRKPPKKPTNVIWTKGFQRLPPFSKKKIPPFPFGTEARVLRDDWCGSFGCQGIVGGHWYWWQWQGVESEGWIPGRKMGRLFSADIWSRRAFYNPNGGGWCYKALKRVGRTVFCRRIWVRKRNSAKMVVLLKVSF